MRRSFLSKSQVKSHGILRIAPAQFDECGSAMQSRKTYHSNPLNDGAQPAGGDGAFLMQGDRQGSPQVVFLSVSDVASRLQVSPDTVLSWIRSGELAAVDVTATGNRVRRHYRVSEESLREFLEHREVRRRQPISPAQGRRARNSGDGEAPLKDFFPEIPDLPPG